jgi:hypothetical protein
MSPNSRYILFETPCGKIDLPGLIQSQKFGHPFKPNGMNILIYFCNFSIMRNLHVLSAVRRWHQSYRALHFPRLFSVSSRLKMTHCETNSQRICAAMQSSRYLISFPIKIPQGTHVDHIFFCQNPVENCTQIFLRFDVNRNKSDVMTSFGMIDWSDVCRVFRQAISSLVESWTQNTQNFDIHRPNN